MLESVSGQPVLGMHSSVADVKHMCARQRSGIQVAMHAPALRLTGSGAFRARPTQRRAAETLADQSSFTCPVKHPPSR